MVFFVCTCILKNSLIMNHMCSNYMNKNPVLFCSFLFKTRPAACDLCVLIYPLVFLWRKISNDILLHMRSRRQPPISFEYSTWTIRIIHNRVFLRILSGGKPLSLSKRNVVNYTNTSTEFVRFSSQREFGEPSAT